MLAYEVSRSTDSNLHLTFQRITIPSLDPFAPGYGPYTF